jgi:prefoldin subunit 5
MASVTGSIAAQRRSIEALKAQLSSFDEQLAALEQVLGPLAEWSKTWADLEQRLLNLGSRPEAGGSVT